MPPTNRKHSVPRQQFPIRNLLLLVCASSVLLGVLRWLNLPSNLTVMAAIYLLPMLAYLLLRIPQIIATQRELANRRAALTAELKSMVEPPLDRGDHPSQRSSES